MSKVVSSCFFCHIFAPVDEWDFGAHWVDEDGQVKSQNYDFGELDTGYYAAIDWGTDGNSPLSIKLICSTRC